MGSHSSLNVLRPLGGQLRDCGFFFVPAAIIAWGVGAERGVRGRASLTVQGVVIVFMPWAVAVFTGELWSVGM